MVYLWCDGNEEAFRKRKNEKLDGYNRILNNEAAGEKRFFDNEELRYSLRSLEKHASWVSHVYIVTDRQVPKWLNLNYDKVSIVDHSQIIPKGIIPCFSSTVIEYFLPFIPNLSERFLYGNDDMFFGRDLKPQDFFNGDRPIVRVKEIKEDKLQKYSSQQNYTYYANVFNSLKLLNATYNKNEYYELHHNVDAYSKSAFLLTYKRFEAELKKCFKNSFRDAKNLQRILFNLDMVYTGKADLKIVDDPKSWRRLLHFINKVDWESYTGNDSERKTKKEILKFKPKLFCLNSGDKCSVEAKIKVKEFMENLFPNPSKFEY